MDPRRGRRSGTSTSSTPPSPTSTGATPRSPRCSRACCGSGSTGASTASGSTSPTAWSRRQGLRDQRGTLTAGHSGAMVERSVDDEPMWDQPEVHDVYRQWRRILDEYEGDRMAVAEAWTQTTDSMVRFVRPDELSPDLQLRLAAGRLVRDGLRRGHPRHARGDAAGRLRPDLGAEQPRRGPAPEPVRRRRPRPGPRPRGHARDARAARVGVPLPGRGARPGGGRRRSRGLAGPRVAAHRRAGPRRLPGPDPVGGRPAAVRLRPRRRPAVDPAARHLGATWASRRSGTGPGRRWSSTARRCAAAASTRSASATRCGWSRGSPTCSSSAATG